MSFRFSRGEPLPEQVRAITLERIHAAMLALHSDNIHDARRRLKQLRALMELVRDKIAKKQRILFRDAGRLVSEARDREVCTQTIEHMSAAAHPPSSRTLSLANKELAQHFDSSKVDVAGAETLLRKALRQSENWRPDVDAKSLRCQLKRAFKRSQCALQKAEEDPSEINTHNLRKRLKVLCSHLGLLRCCWPRLLKEMEREVDKINDLLGCEHDLVILKQRLGERSIAALEDRMNHREEEYRSVALALAHRFLNEDAKEFSKRVFSKKRLK